MDCLIESIPDELYLSYFQEFRNTFQKTYSSQNEMLQRYLIFKKNMNKIIKHNTLKSQYKQEVNFFADMKDEEFE